MPSIRQKPNINKPKKDKELTKFSAPTIEQALLKASKELKCSIVDLEYEIIQKPSKGFLGLGKKDAKIVVSFKRKGRFRDFGKNEGRTDFRNEGQDFKNERRFESKFESESNVESHENKGDCRKNYDLATNTHRDSINKKSDFGRESYFSTESKWIQKSDFHNPQQELIDESLIAQISKEINELFALLPIKLSKIEVAKFDKNTILIHFKGIDAALLIGEKGYRYKAISYLLFNWLNAEYGVNIRLEIESFLASQEAMMANYLAPIIEDLQDSDEPFATKTFDGILAYIALKELRAKLQGKSVVLKTNENDESYILIQSLRR